MTEISTRSKSRRLTGRCRLSVLLMDLRAAGLLALLLLLVAASPASAQNESRGFRRALRLYLSDDASEREAGEALLRKMGRDVLEELKTWIAGAERSLSRVSRLVAELDPQAAPATDRTFRDYFLGKLEEGWDRLEDGDPEQARRIAEALLTFDGESSRVFDYRRLLRATEKRSLRDRVLEPSVRFTERVYEFGEQPVAIFRLRNRLDEQLLIGAQRGILGSLTVELYHRGIPDSRRVETLRFPIQNFQGVERLVLPGKGQKEIRMPIPVEKPLVGSGVVLRIRIEGGFRPSRWEVDGKAVNLTLPVPRSECWIVPAGQRALALSPLRKFEVALIARNIETFFAAGQLAVWAAEDDEEMKARLTKLLVGALPELDDYGFSIADSFLKQLSGLSAGELAEADRDFWKEWYETEKDAEAKNRKRADEPPPTPRVGNEAPDR